MNVVVGEAVVVVGAAVVVVSVVVVVEAAVVVVAAVVDKHVGFVLVQVLPQLSLPIVELLSPRAL